jgi:glycosyltransferase involved in cell wall biosynthesis
MKQHLSCCLVANFNGHGLSQDAAVLELELNSLGFTCVRKVRRDLSWFGAFLTVRRYDLVIFLETVYLRWLFAGRESWLIPNQEWFKAKKLWSLRFVDRVLCKSHHAERIFERYVESKVTYIGFSSLVGKAAVSARKKDFNKWLHVAGGSQSKGTSNLLRAWRETEDPPELILVQRAGNAPPVDTLPASVKLITDYLSDEELQALREEAGVHICPSEAEGFGHNIFQAMLVGSVVITTNFPPMNELIDEDRGFLIEVAQLLPRRLGYTSICDSKDLVRVINRVRQIDREYLEQLGERAQKFAVSMKFDFQLSFRTVIASSPTLRAALDE